MAHGIHEHTPTPPKRAPHRGPVAPAKPPERAPARRRKPVRQQRQRDAAALGQRLSPCHPNEWPYDLEAVHGTRDYDGIIAWYLRKKPFLDRAHVADLQGLFFKYTPGGTHTVHVAVDPEEGHMCLCFTHYCEHSPGWIGTQAAEGFFAEWGRRPWIQRLFPHISTSTAPWAFGARS